MFTFTLPVGFAYCTGKCLAPVRIANLTSKDVPGFVVDSGTCPDCTLPLARIYSTAVGAQTSPITLDRLADLRTGESWSAESYGWRAFEDVRQATHSTYVPGRYTGPDGEEWVKGHMTIAPGAYNGRTIGRMFGWELLHAFGGSVDVQGQRADGAALWGNILRVKAGAGHFDSVCEVLAREGQDLPSVAWDEYGAGRGEWKIGNGHHRMVASLLLGMLTFPIITSSDSYMCGEDSMADEDRPIEYGCDYVLWGALSDVLPRHDGLMLAENGAPRCARCEDGLMCAVACCPHSTACPLRVVPAPVVPAVGTLTREGQEARAAGVEAAREALADLRRAAVDYADQCDREVARLLAEVARVQREASKARARANGYANVIVND